MRRLWSFSPLRNADAGGGGGGGGEADAADAAAGAEAGAAAVEAGAGEGAAAAAASELPARPDWLPEDQWDATTGKPKLDIAAAIKAKTALDERAGQVPADAAGYKIELPEGSTYQVDEADPLLAAAREWAAKEGLTQGQFNGVLALRARMEADANAAWEVAAAAELGKLGDNGPARIDTVTQFLSAKLPKAQFEAVHGVIQSAAGVEAIETIMTLAGGPHLPGGAGGGSDAVSELDYFKNLFGSK